MIGKRSSIARRAPVVALALAACALLSLAAAAETAPSAVNGYGQGVAAQDLLRIMGAIQKLDQGGKLGLQLWAQYPAPSAPEQVLSDLDRIETDIVRVLAPADRDAIFAWLDKGGRDKLYTRGLRDADIGPCVDLIDVAACKSTAAHQRVAAATATGFRDLRFEPAATGAETGGISIEGGFAVVKDDDTSETHCLTFKNAGPKKADAVTFVYRFRASSGAVIFAGSDIRAGSFDPGATIAGPGDAAALRSIHSDGPDRALLENCWTRSGQSPNPALARAASISVGVASVTYDDGSHWAGD